MDDFVYQPLNDARHVRVMELQHSPYGALCPPQITANQNRSPDDPIPCNFLEIDPEKDEDYVALS
jgi:hypothetical protein